MFENQSLSTDSSGTVNSMQELFDFIDTNDFYPFISKSPRNHDNELEEDAIKRIYTDLITVKTRIDDQNMFFFPINIDETIGSEINFSGDTISVNTFDHSKSSSASINPRSLDNDETESFNPKDWMIQDSLTYKLRPPKLYEFLRLLLDNPRYISYASWIKKNDGLFKIHRPIQVAYLWKQVKVRKSNGSMDYDTFARGIRYYYKSGTMIKTRTKHTYCFARV
jgi:hypothetical protein